MYTCIYTTCKWVGYVHIALLMYVSWKYIHSALVDVFVCSCVRVGCVYTSQECGCGVFVWERKRVRASMFQNLLLVYRVAKTNRVPYLYKSFSAKDPYNLWLFCREYLQLKAYCAFSPPCMLFLSERDNWICVYCRSMVLVSTCELLFCSIYRRYV